MLANRMPPCRMEHLGTGAIPGLEALQEHPRFLSPQHKSNQTVYTRSLSGSPLKGLGGWGEDKGGKAGKGERQKSEVRQVDL